MLEKLALMCFSRVEINLVLVGRTFVKNNCDPIDFALNRKSENLMAHPGIEPSSSAHKAIH